MGQLQVTPSDLAGLAQWATSGTFETISAALRELVTDPASDGTGRGLTPIQVRVAREIQRQVHDRYRAPRLSERGAPRITIFLDERAVRQDDLRTRLGLRLGRIGKIERDPTNRLHTEFLSITHPYEQGEFIRLGLPDDGLIDPAMPIRSGELRDRVNAFFGMLEAVSKLKAQRRRLYERIAGIKASWFGHVARKERELAQRHRAVVVREKLTVEAVETDDPGYRGRAFNRMINDGARGQYARKAARGLAWDGVPEIVVPSWYTSTTCFRSATVDASQRRGDTFTSRRLGYRKDADLHAASTLAHYLIPAPVAQATRDT